MLSVSTGSTGNTQTRCEEKLHERFSTQQRSGDSVEAPQRRGDPRDVTRLGTLEAAAPVSCCLCEGSPLSTLTLHLVVKGELLAGADAARGEQGDPGEPLVDVVDEHVKYLQVGVTLGREERPADNPAVHLWPNPMAPHRSTLVTSYSYLCQQSNSRCG